jgi:CHAT domain-containing protein
MAAEARENPLLRSGVALAGANRRASRPGADDGIVTAEEIAALDLRGVEWAVLSACQTGAGEFRAGEGLLGLRRAFQIAGVRTVVMSLWSVDDESTRGWMAALCRARAGGAETLDAVTAASVERLRERRARGRGTLPYYWAPFVASGDWR